MCKNNEHLFISKVNSTADPARPTKYRKTYIQNPKYFGRYIIMSKSIYYKSQERSENLCTLIAFRRDVNIFKIFEKSQMY